MKQTVKKLIHTIVFLVLLASFVPVSDVNAAGLCYVNSNAVSDTNNGTSWSNAYISLQSALADTCTEIWVADGTYTPTDGTDRTISFSLKNGVKIYGGFAGNETLLTQRHPLSHATILSGEIGSAGIADNSYHVISNTNIDSTALLDGFTITGGNANGSSTNDRGGGIFNYKSNPTLKNLIITNNHAKFGGGISNLLDSSPNISNLIFMDNSAEIFGGGMQNYNKSSPSILNSTFVSNTSDWYGGAIHNGGYSYPAITNVTLTKNTASALGGAIYNNLDSNPTIRNTILWGNLAHPSAPEIYNDNDSAGTSTIHNSIVKGGCPQYSTCTSVFLSDPILGDFDNYGGFTPTINIDFGSPAIDAGDEDFCPSTDQRNVARTIGTGCDIGAYEYNTIIVTTINNSGDGSLRSILANSSEGSIVKFDSSLSGQTIHLESPIIIEKGVIIDGSNLSTPIQISGDTNNDGAGEVAVFQTGGSAPIELRNLIITKGKSTGTTGGGGIENYGTLTIKNSTISNNEYVNGLGGGGIYNKGTLTLIDSIISGNTAIEGGGIFNDLNSELTISGTTFSNNSSITEPESPGGSAGAIGNIGTLSIDNCTFTNNLAYVGGGAIVNALNGSATISNSVFTGNTTYGNGGAIINMDATMIVETSTFNSNTSKGGGAIYNDGQLTITGGTFTENDASFGNGGAIANLETLTLADTSISGNSATLGGGIYNSGLEITITNTTIATNSADTGGGGIANQWTGTGSMTITKSSISGNSAPHGGGMHNLSSTGLVSIADSTINDNISAGNGGGIASFGALSLSNTLLLNNDAFDRGGAVFIVGITTISNSTLINNSSREGGGIYNSTTGVLTLTNSTMSENSARDGGAIENTGELIINGTLFSHNQAEDKGGAIHTSSLGSGIIITNSTITQNISVRGGAIGFDGTADNTIRNTTFVHNQAVTGSEIWTFSTAGQVQILNSILLCENSNYCLYYRPGGLSLSSNTLVQSGNLASVGLSPLANNGGPTQTMALLPGSPAINAGNNSTCTQTDQRGVARPQGGNCDLGAFEHNYTGIYYVKTTPAGAMNCQSWDDACTLQSALAAAQSGDQIWVATGVYKPHILDRTISFVIKNGVEMYGGFNGTESQLSERNPDINATILSGDLSGNDNTNIVYNEPTRSENSYHVVVGNYTDATTIFDGFTVTGGNANGISPFGSGGGMYNINGSLTIENVVFTSNSADTFGGGIYNENSNSVFKNISFNNNTTAYIGGGMYNEQSNLILTNATFSQNFAQHGGGILNHNSAPLLTNITFSNNTATGSGGGMLNVDSSPVIINSTFNNNAAATGGGIWSGDSSTFVLTNAIIANSTGGDCVLEAGSNVSVLSKNNLIEDTSNTCGLVNGEDGNIIGNDPNLGPLTNNGGSTLTHALFSNSPAINAGDDTVSICDGNTMDNYDQRGIERPQGAHCDIGAYEYVDETLPTVVSIVKASTSPTNAANVNFTVTFSEPVFNVDISDFSLTTSNITGASIANVSGSGTTFTVNVNTGSGDGTLRLNVNDSTNITDSIGNLLNGGFFDGEVYTTDKTAPIITINNPNTASAQSKSITANTSDGTLTMSNITGSTCDGTLTFIAYSNQTFSSESDNGIKVCYKGVDSLGNTAYSLSNAITGIDTTAPNTQFNSTPSNPTTETTANFTFSSPDVTSSFECSLDEASFIACTSPYQVNNLSGGSHNLKVRAKDPAGNLDETPASFVWTIDLSSPFIRFGIIGDYGLAGIPEESVSVLVKSWDPDFIITTGDNNYPYGAPSTIDANIGQYYQQYISPYIGTYGIGSTTNRFFPSLGNHDWVTKVNQLPKAYLDYFSLPGNERYYEFTQGPIHFFVLDSDPNEPDGNTTNSVQGQWLQAALAASTEQWNIVYFHHSPYSSSQHGSYPAMQWPFKEWGADIVITGHDHVYERLFVDGFPYIVNGLGGYPSIYNFNTPIPGSLVRYNSNHGAILAEGNSDYLNFKFINLTGDVIDSYTLGTPPTPAILSIQRASASPTSAASVDFTVTFSEAVQNVDVNDFTLNSTSVTSASITNVTGSGSTRTVTVNTGTGNGTIRLDVPNTATISDLSSNALHGLPFTSGEVYAINKMPTSATFGDVPMNHPYWEDIEILYANGFTAGCSTSPLLFCPEATMNRGESAVFMLRGNFGSSYVPPNPPYSPIFVDNWSLGPWAQKWAQGMLAEGLTAGCSTSPLLYCPWEQMPRLQAAVFGMRLMEGNTYNPPAATGTVFADITDPTLWYAKWAEAAYNSGILPACGMQGGKPLFCPNQLVSRGLGAYMIVRAKNLSMP